MNQRSRPFLAAALLLASAPALPAEEFKSSELDGLAKRLTGYIEARREGSGLDKAQEDVAKELEKIQKRIKRDPLSLPDEIGRALWTSLEKERKGSVAKGKVDDVTIPGYWDPKAKFTYAVWVPGKYDARKTYPIVLCIPDAGERPTDHLTERWADSALRDAAVLVAMPMPEDTGTWLEGINKDKQTGMGFVAQMYAQATRTLAVDYDRVYLAGHGRGVELALAYATSFPDRFAGVIGRAGDVGACVPENLRNLPTFFAGAGGKATELADKVKALGYDNLTLMPEGKEADVWSWMQGHARVANPSEVMLQIGSPVPSRAYWLEVRPTDGQGTAYLKGKIDRGTNTITVDGEGVQRFTLYLNDVLVDMDKPVQVVCNGTRTERTVPRSLQRTLDLILNSRSDPAKVYTNMVEFDLPPKAKEKGQ